LSEDQFLGKRQFTSVINAYRFNEICYSFDVSAALKLHFMLLSEVPDCGKRREKFANLEMLLISKMNSDQGKGAA
jgi:hypothetical protein